MKKYLTFIFLIINSFVIYGKKSYHFEEHLNSRSEALGNTGMIFGEEYGSFFSSPTSIQKDDINLLGVIGYSYVSSKTISINGALFAKTKVGNFFTGYYHKGDILIFQSILPISYSIDIYNLSLGFGLIYNTKSGWGENIKYLSTNFSIMYKSYIGNFALALNNIVSKAAIKDSTNIFSEGTLPLNLKIGYGKEFYLNYGINKIQLAFEFEDLLMNSKYINNKEKDYNLYNKIHLGVEATKNTGEFTLALRSGIKNFLPTFGIGLEWLELIRLEYAITNEDTKYSLNNRIIQIFSVEIRANNLAYQNTEKYRKWLYEK